MQSEETQVNKTIYISKAACGTGKTKSLVNNFGRFRSERVLIVSPTIQLCEDIENRLKDAQEGLRIKAVHSEMPELMRGTSVQSVVTTQMTPKLADIPTLKLKSCCQVLIITTATFEKLDPSYLKGWVVIIDELINTEELKTWSISKASHKSIESYIVINEETKKLDLLISGEDYEAVVNNHRSALNSEAKSLLIAIKESPTGVYQDITEKRFVHYRTAYLKENVKALLEASKETHVLGANFRDTFFHIVFEYWGFKFRTSIFKPNETEHINTHHIELIKLLPDETNLSKYNLNKVYPDKETVLERLLKVSNNILKRDYLVVVNDWAWKKKLPFLNSVSLNIQKLNYDPRGINEYIDSAQVVLLASYNPSPTQVKNLSFLAEHMGKDKRVLEKCWVVSKYTEMLYQQAARTSLRKNDNSEQIKIVIADKRALDYLKKQFPDAKVNTNHVIELPVDTTREDGRKTVKGTDKRRMGSDKEQLIINLLHEGKSGREIAAKAKCSTSTVSKIRRQLKCSEAL